MRRVLIVLGVLGSGTALSFGAAAAVLLASPEARMVPNNAGVMRPLAQPGAGVVVDPGFAAKPMPLPAIDLPGRGFGPIPPEMEAAIKEEVGRGVNLPPAIDLPPQSGTGP